MPFEFNQLTSNELLQLPREKTVFFLSIGAPEDHGPHLPLGTSLIKAREITKRCATQLEQELPGWTAIFLPEVAIALDSNVGPLALRVRPHVLRDLLIDQTRTLIEAGFCYFICNSGSLGPKQLTAIEEASTSIQHSTRWIRLWRNLTHLKGSPLPVLISASSALVSPQEVWRSLFFADPIEHGGRRDTSITLAISPTSVRKVYTDLPTLQPQGKTKTQRWIRHLRNKSTGYWGKPAEATAAWGANELDQIMESLFPKIRAVLEGASPQWLFRSWYSIIPSNRTFFKAWILSALLAIVLLSWTFLTLWTSISS